MKTHKYIEGYEGIYTISNTGIVTNAKGRQMKFGKSNSGTGYYQVALCKNGYVKMHSVHRLVAIAFVDNIENKPFVNHKDGNKWNNDYMNLEWVTRKENALHSIHVLGNPIPPNMKGKFGAQHNRSKIVYEFDSKGNLLNTYGSGLEFKRKTGICNSSVYFSNKYKKPIFGKYYQYTPHFQI